MKKPKEIIDLEKFYGIELREIDVDISIYENRNYYKCDANGSVIGLNLSGNKITKIEGLDSLTNLTELYLSKNQISHIESLDRLTNLTKLYLFSNQISHIKGLDRLTNLIVLSLSYNQISRIEGLDRLKKLTALYLYSNQISRIEGLNVIPSSLKYLGINDNPFVQSMGLYLGIGKNHLDIIKGALEKLKITAKYEVLLPQKIMLLGNHAVGKSSFRHYFIKEEVLERKEAKSTDILDVHYYQKDDKADFPDAVFYDFGGQDYYHGIYKAFFTTKAINMLFWNEETDKNKVNPDSNGLRTTHFNRDYWLGQIEYALKLNNNTNAKEKIFVVQTFADENEQITTKSCSKSVQQQFYISLGEKQLMEQDNKYVLSLKYLVQCIKEEIEGRQKKEKTQNEIDLYKYVYEEKGAKSVNIIDLKDIFGLSIEALRGELEQLAYQGLVMYYNTDELRDVVWLEPVETVKKIHEEILKKSIIKKNKGRVPFDEFEKLFEDDNYLFKLLINEKIIFHDTYYKKIIIPGYLPLLPKDSDDMFWITQSYPKHSMVLKFKSFIPFGLINQLICYYGQNPNKKKYFRDFLMFTHKELEVSVLVQLDFAHLEINISIIPQSEGNIEQAENEILDDILYMYWGITLPDANKEESVGRKIKKERQEIPADLYISLDNEYFVSLCQLETENDLSKILFYQKNEKTQTLKEEGQSGNVFQFRHITNNEKLKNTKKIFISYSKHDIGYLYELEEHLRDVEPKLEIYYDKSTDLGDNVHRIILEKIKDCDYVIALVSKDFLNTNYIRDIEIPEMKKYSKKIIPIIVGPCLWEEIFENYALNKGDCVSLIGDKEATKIERQAKWVNIIKEFKAKLKGIDNVQKTENTKNPI